MTHRILGALIVAALGTSSVHAFEFQPYQTTDAGASPGAVAIGDINGDGRDDIVVATDYYFDPASDYHVFAWLQQADGTLAAPVRAAYGATANRNGIELLDLDGDGNLEVVVGHGTGISVLDWQGAGFAPAQVVNAGRASDVIVAIDANRDGHQDIVGLAWSGSATVFYGNGTGGFASQAAITTPQRGYNDLEVADINQDGFDDLVISSGQGLPYGIWVMYHDGIAGFGPAQFVPTPDNAWGIAVGDFNGDGLPDVLGTRARNSPTAVHLLAGQPDGTLVHTTSYGSYDIPEAAEAADLDGDGRDDAVVLHGGWNRAGVYLGNGTGLDPEKLYPVTYASHYDAEGLALGDFNGDGCKDAAIADYNYGLVTLQGSGCVDPTIDLGISGFFSGRSLVVFDALHAFGTVAARNVTVDVTFTSSRGYAPRVDVAPAECARTASDSRTVGYRCTLGELAAGGAATLRFDVRGHGLSATGEVSTTSIDTNPANDTVRF